MEKHSDAMEMHGTSAPVALAARNTDACDSNRMNPNPFKKPARTCSDTKSAVLARRNTPKRPCRMAETRMQGAMYSTPCVWVSAESGTMTTAAVPDMTPSRAPINGAVRPMTTDDQIPTRGLTPTMAEHAIALESNEKATVIPASPSCTRLGDESSLSSIESTSAVLVLAWSSLRFCDELLCSRERRRRVRPLCDWWRVA
mmetsp:Transcript_4800/g.8956  ORF Transcript_4800/g.8956 Transcript_4800/m.8956 type:complete len:200 (-) Transcript_4800:206-805(-)